MSLCDIYQEKTFPWPTGYHENLDLMLTPICQKARKFMYIQWFQAYPSDSVGKRKTEICPTMVSDYLFSFHDPMCSLKIRRNYKKNPIIWSVCYKRVTLFFLLVKLLGFLPTYICIRSKLLYSVHAWLPLFEVHSSGAPSFTSYG